MATVNIPFQVKGTSVAGRVPTTADLLERQIAVNLADRKLFTKDASGNIIQIGVATSDFAEVAFTADYASLINTPTIPAPYVLPAATAAILGGIKAGTGTTVAGDGTLSADVQTVRGQDGVAKTGAVVITRADIGLDILDANDKIELAYLPDSITSALTYIGTWDASTNTPTIPAAGAGNQNNMYKVAVAGSTDIDGITTWNVGDLLISNGTVWQRVPATDVSIVSVNGQTGIVTIDATNLPGLSLVGRTGQYTDLIGIPTTFVPSAHNQSIDTITDASLVAKTGQYSDLLGLPPNPANVSVTVNVNGNPIIEPVTYIFTDSMEFPENWVGSKAYATMQTGTQANVRIMKALAATPNTFTQVGSLLYNTSNNTATFTTTATSPTQFAPGDLLRYEWVSSGIATIVIALKATKL